MWSQVGLRKSITTNKASGGDGIPVVLFQILKDDAVKAVHSICQKIWKTQQWPQDWKRSVFIPIPKKGNTKECSNYRRTALISHATSLSLFTFIMRLFRIAMKTDIFQFCGHCWVFQICWHIECNTFIASSFRLWNSSAGIPCLWRQTYIWLQALVVSLWLCIMEMHKVYSKEPERDISSSFQNQSSHLSLYHLLL